MIFSEADHIEQIKRATKTQTRRPSDRYQVGHLYAIQPGRGKKGIPDGKILITAKDEEWNTKNPVFGHISRWAAKCEGGYTPKEYEDLYEKMYPGWNVRYVYVFEYWSTEELESIHQALEEAKTEPSTPFTIVSQQLRNSDPSVSAEADELETAKSEITAYPPKAEAEKEEKKNVQTTV